MTTRLARFRKPAIMGLRALVAVTALLSSAPAQDRDRADLRVAVDAYMAPLVEARLFSGSVLLAKGGKIEVAGGYGKAHFGEDVEITAETRFKLMSVTKPFTAIAVVTLAERGKLALADPVSKHLSAWPAAWRAVTLHHLLGHSSGIPNLEMDWVGVQRGAEKRGLALWPKLAAKVAGRKLMFPPGTRPSYSNFNFVLLGFVVEAVSGQSYRNYLRTDVLDSVGMKRTGLDDGSRFPGLAMGYFLGRSGALRESRQDMSIIEAAGGLYSTPGDLYRLDRALHTDELLSASAKKVLFTPVSANLACGWKISRVLERRCIHHEGGANGYLAEFLRFPAEDACVIVLSNFAFAPIGRISRDLAAMLFGEPYDNPKSVLPETLDRCVGLFRSKAGPGPIMIRRSGRRLLAFRVYARASRSVGQLLVPLSNDAFGTAAASLFRLRFVRDPEGKARRLRFEAGAKGKVTEELERFEVDPEPWRKMVGAYDVEPQLGATVTLVEKGGDLELRIAGWRDTVTIAPVSEKLALAFTSVTLGTRFQRQPAAENSPVGFVWQLRRGQTFRGTRQGP